MDRAGWRMTMKYASAPSDPATITTAHHIHLSCSCFSENRSLKSSGRRLTQSIIIHTQNAKRSMLNGPVMRGNMDRMLPMPKLQLGSAIITNTASKTYGHTGRLALTAATSRSTFSMSRPERARNNSSHSSIDIVPSASIRRIRRRSSLICTFLITKTSFPLTRKKARRLLRGDPFLFNRIEHGRSALLLRRLSTR